ncbi:hypothetical protein SAY87_029511 [Trapa incisa]|uniref:Uncharacterized protein n=1 Tax=Trapa incisa TaxID=236973 RepID=A0AAN7Q8X5_9MYRT|nr:hypothetical protein SAY87_029511 [Trapa incisa]
MELDMEFARDNNTRYPAFGATNKELHTDRKLKATVNRLPEACTQNLIRFFDAGPFHCRDLASSSSSAGINDARIPTDYEQSTLEDINLDLSLGPVNKTVKGEALNLNFEPSY